MSIGYSLRLSFGGHIKNLSVPLQASNCRSSVQTFRAHSKKVDEGERGWHSIPCGSNQFSLSNLLLLLGIQISAVPNVFKSKQWHFAAARGPNVMPFSELSFRTPESQRSPSFTGFTGLSPVIRGSS